MKGNNPSDKFLLVIYGLLVIILQMNLLTDKARKKNFYPLHSVSTSIAKYNISPIKKSCHSISDYFSFVGMSIDEFDI
jgi:hypothetical protein